MKTKLDNILESANTVSDLSRVYDEFIDLYYELVDLYETI